MSLGDEISLGGKKSRKSNIGGGEIDSEDTRSLVKSSKESGEMFPGVTGEIACAPETSLSRITSSPSLSPQHTPVSTPSTSQSPNTQPTPTAEEAIPMPHESPLYSVHSLGLDEGSQTKKTYCTAITKLVKKLEQKVKTTKARRRARIVLSEDEVDVEDSSK
ncbi:hypothetical protein Tco_1166072 [Tanacetum coccineum]